MPTDKYSSHASFKKKKLFAENGDHDRDPQLVKMQRLTDCGVPNPNLI